MQPAIARVPVRIDLAGGTLDIWPIPLVLGGAHTVNAALGLTMEARITPRDDGAIHLESRDLGVSETYDDYAELGYALDGLDSCKLPLLGRAVLQPPYPEGFSLVTHAPLPAGSGLGGSSALLCAIVGALEAAQGRTPEPRALHPRVQEIETHVLGTPTGYQDYFPPLLGGCLDLYRSVGGFDVERLPVDLDALGRRLRLVYTGEPHHSGITNWGVLRAFFDGEKDTVEALWEIKRAAYVLREALAAGDLDAALREILRDGAVRRQMAPGVSTPTIEALDEAMRAAGALGTKICGAGGGGCVLVLLPDEATGAAVDAALAAGPWEPMPLKLVSEGLTIGTPEA